MSFGDSRLRVECQRLESQVFADRNVVFASPAGREHAGLHPITVHSHSVRLREARFLDAEIIVPVKAMRTDAGVDVVNAIGASWWKTWLDGVVEKVYAETQRSERSELGFPYAVSEVEMEPVSKLAAETDRVVVDTRGATGRNARLDGVVEKVYAETERSERSELRFLDAGSEVEIVPGVELAAETDGPVVFASDAVGVGAMNDVHAATGHVDTHTICKLCFLQAFG